MEKENGKFGHNWETGELMRLGIRSGWPKSDGHLDNVIIDFLPITVVRIVRV